MSKHRKPSVYLAGPWFTPDAKIIQSIAKSIIKDCPDWESLFPDELSIGCNPADTFTNNVKAIEKCDMLVALIDVKDSGTAWEIGLAYALKKRVILVVSSFDSFISKTNLMLAFAGDAILIKDLEKLLKEPVDFDNFIIRKNTWEGLE